MSVEDLCFCGSGLAYKDCCEPCHMDMLSIESVTQLVRARYSAFVLKLTDFIRLTMIGPSLEHFDEHDILNSPIKWHSIKILNVDKGTKHDSEGTVEFLVTCSESEDAKELFSVRETSLFKKVDGQWFYVDALKLSREVL